jgi:predicted porin
LVTLRSAVCTLFLATTALAAHAQITIYGSVDAGVDHVSNSGGGSLWALNSGKRQPDRLGFQGVEDLGSGLTAFYKLELGLNLKNGSQANPNLLFNRFALVGLSNASWGSVSLGHMPDFMYTYISSFSNSVPGISSSFTPGNFDNLANQFQLDNAVKYESPVLGGFQFGAINGFGEAAGDFNKGRRYSAGLKYDAGPLKLAAAYAMYHDRVADIRGVFGLTSILGTPIAAGATYLAPYFRTAGAGASYAMGIFSPHVMVTDIRFDNGTSSTALRNYNIGLNTDISGGSKTDLLGVSYGHSTFESLSFNQYNLFLSHNLSKRTQVYTGAAYVRASGTNAIAGFTGYKASTTDTQTLVRVGMNHVF